MIEEVDWNDEGMYKKVKDLVHGSIESIAQKLHLDIEFGKEEELSNSIPIVIKNPISDEDIDILSNEFDLIEMEWEGKKYIIQPSVVFDGINDSNHWNMDVYIVVWENRNDDLV